MLFVQFDLYAGRLIREYIRYCALQSPKIFQMTRGPVKLGNHSVNQCKLIKNAYKNWHCKRGFKCLVNRIFVCLFFSIRPQPYLTFDFNFLFVFSLSQNSLITFSPSSPRPDIYQRVKEKVFRSKILRSTDIWELVI